MSAFGSKLIIAVLIVGIVVLAGCLLYEQAVITQQAVELRMQLQSILHGCH